MTRLGRTLLRIATLTSLFTAFVAAGPAEVFAQPVAVDDVWVRATVAQQRASGAFMKLTARSALKLVGARSPVAAIVEIHQMTMSGDVMKMRAVESLDLPSGKVVAIEPGGYHVMLIDLKQQIKEGDAVPITLLLEGADGQPVAQDIIARAVALTVKSGEGAGHSMHGKAHRH